MSKITKQMEDAIKDTLAVVLLEQNPNALTTDGTQATLGDIREWLDTVKTPQDFFGNTQTLAYKEYANMIKTRENEADRARKRVTV